MERALRPYGDTVTIRELKQFLEDCFQDVEDDRVVIFENNGVTFEPKTLIKTGVGGNLYLSTRKFEVRE